MAAWRRPCLLLALAVLIVAGFAAGAGHAGEAGTASSPSLRVTSDGGALVRCDNLLTRESWGARPSAAAPAQW